MSDSGAVAASEKTEIEYGLLINADNAYSEIRKVEIIMMRVMGMVIRLSGGDPNLQKWVNNIQQAIMWIRHLEMTIHAFEMAMGPEGNALLMVYAAVMGGSLFLSSTDTLSNNIRTAS